MNRCLVSSASSREKIHPLLIHTYWHTTMSKSVSFGDLPMVDSDNESDQERDTPVGGEGDQNEELTIVEEYKLWRKNCRYMYDFISETALTWPSLSIEWVPGNTFQNKTKDTEAFKVRNLLLSTHTSGEDIDYLKIASTQLPVSVFPDANETKLDLSNVNSRLKISKKLPQDHEINRVRAMPQDPHYISTINGQGEVYLYHLDDEFKETSPAKKLVHHTDNGFGLSWNPVQRGKLLTSSDDKTIALWDLDQKIVADSTEVSPYHVYSHHQDIVNDVKWNHIDSNCFGAVSEDKLFSYQDIRALNTTPIFNKVLSQKTSFNSISFSTYSKNLFAVGGEDSNIYLYDLRNLSQSLHVMMGHTKPVTNIEWDPHHESILASSSLDRRIILWDISKIGEEQLQDEMEDGVPELLMMHGGHTGGINDFQFNGEIPWCLASCSDDNIVHVWKVSKSIVEEQEENVDPKELE